MEDLRVLEIRERLKTAPPGSIVKIEAAALALILDWADAMLQTNDDLGDWVLTQDESVLKANGFAAIYMRSAARLHEIAHRPYYKGEKP